MSAATASVAGQKAAEKKQAFEQAVAYVERMTQVPYPGDLWEWLKDGTVLCELVNRIKPGIIRKVNSPGMPFREMENLDKYTAACRELGVKPNNTFR